MKLKSGGILFEEEYNSKTKKYDLIDVTDKAPAYLHENVQLENVTVRDIFALIAKHPAIRAMLTRNYIDEFLAHIATNPASTAKVNPENPEASIEFIELYRNAHYDEALNRLEFNNIPSVHGMSHILVTEHEGFKPGTRINWSLSFTPIGDILDTPIQTKSMVETQQDNYLNHYNFSNSIKFERQQYTLFEIINAISWELSFYGSPEDCAETGDKVKELVEDVEEAIEAIENGEIEADEVFHSMDDIFPREELLPGFSFISPEISKKQLNTLLHYLPNKVDMAMFCATAFPGQIFIKEELIGLTAYEYRHKMRKADEDLLVSEEMKKIINNNQGLRPPHTTCVDDFFYELVQTLGGKITPEQLYEIEIT